MEKLPQAISRNIESNNFTPKTNELSQRKIPVRPSWTNSNSVQMDAYENSDMHTMHFPRN